MGAKYYLLWHIMVLNCHVCLLWPYVALKDWPYLALYGLVAFHGYVHLWPHSA